jgi:hypothetical protein
MSDSLAGLRDRYFESLLGRIPLQRIAIFSMFLVALVVRHREADSGFFVNLASVTLNDLIYEDNAILWRARLGDVVLALLASATIGYMTHALRMMSFRWFVTLRNPDQFMRKLTRGAGDVARTEVSSSAARIQADVERNEKELRRRGAATELLLAVAVIPYVFFHQANLLDILAASVGLFGCFLMVWRSYLFYVTDALPALILSSQVSGAGVAFGDALVDEEKVLFGRLEQKRRDRRANQSSGG